MNTTYRFTFPRIAACLPLIVVTLFCSQPAWADSRQDALFELDRLHQSTSASAISDELKSVDATFAVAEHYFQSNELEQSERFYLLTVQKARIILATLQKTAHPAGQAVSPTPVSDPAVPSNPPASVDTPPVAPQQPAAPAVPEVDPQPTVTVAPEAAPMGAPETGSSNVAELPTEAETEPSSDKLVGTSSTYTVVQGDTIRLVAAKLGVSRQQLLKRNNLDEKAYLKIGQKLAYNNRKIVPQRIKNGIIVNIPDRTLYLFKQGKVAVTLPVALGVAVKSEKYDWQTPTGKFKITAKMKDPTWHVPPSIQSEMEDHGKEVITSVPPGDGNPLGKYAMKTSIPGILIHSTTKPWSIYSFASHGCIRVYPEQMEEFFKEVKVNTLGEIIYKPVKLAVTEEGRVYLEVHRDIYGKSTGLATEAKRLIEKNKLTGQVDWKKVDAIILRKSGIAEDITL